MIETTFRRARDLLPSGDYADFVETADAAELIAYVGETAAYFWAFHVAKSELEAMDVADRVNLPDYQLALVTAEAGMIRAKQNQERAKAALEALNSFPSRWAHWPERRKFSRPDLR